MSALASAVIGAAVLPPVHAAGLGKLTVLSALGQPLRAEIELTAVTPDEANGLAVKLAPLEAFRAANVEFNPALLNLRFDIEQRDGRRFIRVTSAQPVNEPFVDMLLELSWANGRLVREYTFLLDPAEMRNAQSPQVAAPVDVNRSAAAAPATPAAPSAASSAANQAAPARPAERAETDDIRVKRGDTLSGIASEIRPADVSLDMMLVALFRANPEAFSGNNMNRLKAGRILSVPDTATVRATDRSEARRIVIAHAADFNAYRDRLAAQVEAAKPAQAPAAQQSAGGKITAKVEERPNAVAEAQDKLKLSKAGEASAKAGEAGAAGGVEDKIAKDQQVADAAARVKELEKNVSDLEKLMAVKSQAGADAQNSAAVPEMDNKGGPVAAAPQPMAPVTAPAKAAAAPPPAVVPPQRMEPGFMDALKDNMAALGIALAAILGGTALILARRRKAREAMVVQRAPAAAPAPAEPAAQALFDEPGGQNVDTGNSVFNSHFAPSASQLDMNEVDPVAEADVYIAYGRDAQAEEILKDALRTHPERHAARLKLMEIYANRKDLRAFEVQANELFALTKGQGDEWAQAAALGRSIDPGNPLYAAPDGAAGAFAATAAAAGAAALAAEAAHAAAQPAPSAGFAAVLDDAARARAAEPAPHEGLDLDLSSEPAPEAAVNALDFDFADTPAPAPAADGLADFDVSDATAQPDVAEPPATPAQPKVGEAGDADHYLDFDLGGLDFEPAPPAAGEAAAKAPADPLDFALDQPAAAPQPTPEPTSAPEFDLDLPAEKTAAPAPGADPLAELDLMDFDVPPPAQADGTRPPADPAPALDDADFGLPDLPQAPAAAPPPPEFDLSGIDLDLDETATPQPEPAPSAPLSPQQMEMDTKLDLAVAYQEIGDKEGARELLDEVLRGGTDEQVARANQMLAQLG